MVIRRHPAPSNLPRKRQKPPLQKEQISLRKMLVFNAYGRKMASKSYCVVLLWGGEELK